MTAITFFECIRTRVAAVNEFTELLEDRLWRSLISTHVQVRRSQRFLVPNGQYEFASGKALIDLAIEVNPRPVIEGVISSDDLRQLVEIAFDGSSKKVVPVAAMPVAHHREG